MQYDLFELYVVYGLIMVFILILMFFPHQAANFGIWLHNLILPFIKPLATQNFSYIK